MLKRWNCGSGLRVPAIVKDKTLVRENEFLIGGLCTGTEEPRGQRLNVCSIHYLNYTAPIGLLGSLLVIELATLPFGWFLFLIFLCFLVSHSRCPSRCWKLHCQFWLGRCRQVSSGAPRAPRAWTTSSEYIDLETRAGILSAECLRRTNRGGGELVESSHPPELVRAVLASGDKRSLLGPASRASIHA